MNRLLFGLAVALSLAAAQPSRTFTGIITDDMCTRGGHAAMGMGPTDAECALACVSAHGASYVLYDGKNVYTLTDQKTPEQFAAQRVRVVGTLDSKTRTIHVKSMAAARMKPRG